ncbi:hypothetical protein R2B67_26125 [Streptomyces cyaneofuscatus]|uniref:hypothetical protein n=1 Tax=Streptomyces cyaneofuscatus TaxID=66883 RepID=UPI002954F9AA|nr:hypothetical protein [Streptomyces cyaneofuscatus]WOP11798.1 hypothetical protein R2B67_26125 [Streptomyces cyaneofuscatus]
MTQRSTVAAQDTLGRPAPGINGLLVIDAENIRARYDCYLCRTTEGPVYGTTAVTAFTAEIRTTHPTRCGTRENRS